MQVDVIQVVGAADSLHHPALWCDHVKGKKWGLREFHEAGRWSWRYCVISQESHIRLQDIAVKAVKTSRDDQITSACPLSRQLSKELRAIKCLTFCGAFDQTKSKNMLAF